jgi:predicted aspartyl protease
LPLILGHTQLQSNVIRIEGLIDTGCNADLCISRHLAQKLQLEIKTLKNKFVQFAKGNKQEAEICKVNASFLNLDLQYLDFEAIAFVTDKENWQEVEIGNKLLSKFCVHNKLVMEFDYYENQVKFKNRRKR